jgi:hypothetical protein
LAGDVKDRTRVTQRMVRQRTMMLKPVATLDKAIDAV